jgi:hypothetical protein
VSDCSLRLKRPFANERIPTSSGNHTLWQAPGHWLRRAGAISRLPFLTITKGCVMKTKLIAAVIASGCLFGLQASASAQSYAFSGAETQQYSAYLNGAPAYWDYAPNVVNTAPARVIRHHRVNQ